MSKSIRVALICLGVLAVFRVAWAIYDMEYTSKPLLGLSVDLVVNGLLAFGIVRGNQFAWCAARFVALLGSSIALIMLAFYGAGLEALLIAMVAAPAVGIYVSLGKPDARAHFNLI